MAAAAPTTPPSAPPAAAAAAADKDAKAEPKPEAKQRWVMNNRDGAHGIQLRGVREDVSGTIRPGKLINLLPGWNLVDGKQWAEAKENPMVQVLLAERIKPSRAPEQKLERVGHTMLAEGPAVADPEMPLHGVGEDEAIAMVDQILDHLLLARLTRVEKRPRVVHALQEKSDDIDPRRTKIKTRTA